jgi:exonuclease SbcC
MIPISLTIQGLYSYRKRQTIDFTKLVRSGLFGIFGGVGSGKSTILEAISFALFAESERLNKGDDRNYNMMNLQSNELYIDFEFRTGNDNNYRFVVRGKRNNKRFDEVKTFERSAYRKENEEWIPIDEASAETITGLNYNNFHRTIIIPQGRFQDFLQLKPKDRTTMLQELFSLNKFELSGNIARLETQNTAQLQHIQGQLQEIGIVNTDDISNIQLNIENKKLLIKSIEADLQLKTKENQDLARIKEVFTKLENNKKQFDELLKQKPQIEALGLKIQEYEQFVLLFKSDIENHQVTTKNLETITLELEKAEKDQQLIQNEIQLRTNDFETIKKAYLLKDSLIHESDDIVKICTIRDLITENNKLFARIENGKLTLLNTSKSISEKKERNSGLTEKISKNKLQLPDLALLSVVKEWFTIKKNISTSVVELRNKIVLLQADHNNKAKHIDSVLSNCPINISHEVKLGANDIAKFVQNEKSNFENLQKELHAEILHLEVQNKLSGFISEIEDGKPCPLCGSEHHPQILNNHDVTELLKNKRLEIEKQLANSKILDIWEKEISQLFVQTGSIAAQIKLESDLLLEKELKLKEHDEKFIWNNYPHDNEQFITDAFKLAETLNAEINKWETDLKQISKEIDKEEIDKEKFNKALESLTSQEAANNVQIKLLTDQLKLLSVTSLKSETNEQLLAKSKSLVEKHNQLITNYETSEKLIAELNKRNDILTGSIHANKASQKQLQEYQQELNNCIQEKILRNGNHSYQYIQQILLSKPDVDLAHKQMNTFGQNFESTKKSIAELEKELNGCVYDEIKHNAVILKFKELSEQLSQNNKELGSLEKELSQIKIKLEKFKLLQEEKEKLELRAGDIAELKNLFRGNAFVNYISTVYLYNLCQAANERFYMLSKQKLRLELAEDNSFLVRDYMNGGKLRSVKTLSGGQVFQASLSLALSLADSIHNLSANNENFFFLDEGFGTLDKESLSIVFDTLKALRKENRIVGVISHVEEMQQEIETYLKITNDEELGSIIQSSY